MYSVSRGDGIFDTGATGNAISKVQLEKLMEGDPSDFGEIDSDRVRVIGFGGGAKVLSLGFVHRQSLQAHWQTQRLNGTSVTTQD